MKNLSLLLLIFILVSCQKSEDISTTPPEITVRDSPDYGTNYIYPEEIWTDVLQEDSTDALALSAIQLENGNLITSIEDKLVCYNYDTGERVWEKFHGGINRNKRILNGNNLYVHSFAEIFNIDTNTGELVWSSDLGGHGNTLSFQQDRLFTGIGYNSSSFKTDSSAIVEIDLATGDIKHLFGIANDTFTSSLKAPGVYIDSQNDTILIFQNRSILLDPPYTGDRIDLYAYNITQKELLWCKKDFDLDGLSNIVNPPIVDGDKVYFGGSRTVYCIDIATGDILWQNRYGHSNLLRSNYQIVGDKFLFNLQDSFIALNKHTGDQLWIKEDVNSTGLTTISNGRIYATMGEFLYILNLETGQQLYKMRPPISGGGFHGTIAVDEEHQTMFTTDFYTARCMKLPK